jgi:response regulator RpfG family c-di-GMP phosphodiesterase
MSLLTDMRDNGFMQPFIFVTAYPSQDSTIQALRLGAFDYVEKPFESEELKLLIVEAVRVSHEMNRLDVKSPAKTIQNAGDSHAVSEIRKLKTLRYTDANCAEAKDDSRKDRLLEMFVSEAMPQLLFCDAAIKGLDNYDERSFELGYLFRVMQAIGTAAESISAQNVVTVAREAEKFYTALRVRPRAVTPNVTELAIRTNEVLKNLVNNLTKNFHLLSKDHETVVTEIKQKTSNLESAA